MTTTAWGKATALEHIEIAQKADDKEFTTVIELLESDDGETMVRFAYTTGGAARRGPVTLRAADLYKMKKALEKKPRLAAALSLERRRETKAAPPP